jgi:hypothetical protein
MDEVRTEKHKGSVNTFFSTKSQTHEEKHTWRIIRKKLEHVGITSELFTENIDLIKKTIQDAVEFGDLPEIPNYDEETPYTSAEKVISEDLRAKGKAAHSPISNSFREDLSE